MNFVEKSENYDKTRRLGYDGAMIYLPRSSYTVKPWKNGLGTTEEIYVYPEGSEDFLFRVSMAALTQSGPFSFFPGIDRSLILLEGDSVKLNASVVPLLSPVNFPGEEKVMATIQTEGRDLNLMTRRGKASGKIHVVSDEAVWAGEVDLCLIFALTDSVHVGADVLRTYDSCLLISQDRNIVIKGKSFLKIDLSFKHKA